MKVYILLLIIIATNLSMHIHVYTLIYYSGIRVKNLNFGLKNIHCELLLCITDVYYYYVFLCTVYYY